MMLFTYLSLAFAVLGTVFGGMLILGSILQSGVPEVSDQLMRGGFPMLFGSLVLGMAAEISLSLGKRRKAE